jgi:hypothetical protein
VLKVVRQVLLVLQILETEREEEVLVRYQAGLVALVLSYFAT